MSFLLLAWAVFAPDIASGQVIDFNRDIRPILAENCFICHGPDRGTREVDLRLDDRETAIRLGAIVPGDAESSSLIDRIFETDPDGMMPPLDSRKSLTPEQRLLLKRWIEQGATYDVHWAYRPIVKPGNPSSAGIDQSSDEQTSSGSPRVHNSIDAFVVARLSQSSLIQNREADRTILARRLYLDLVGLPPSPEELREFCADDGALAYERLVDRLLASPHFGERLATMWLDAVRYADTVGYHGDQNQNAFAYRDWVIDALNANMPFDQFTIEQLAGDLLPQPTESMRIATCFNRLNMMTREGGAQPEEYLAKYAADRVRTIGTAWLGSTLGCAECHDHKYDPFSMEDFYSFAAFFADLKQWGVYQDYPYTPNPDLRHWSNDHPFPPELEVDVPYLARRHDRLCDKRTTIAREFVASAVQDAGLRESFEAWKDDAVSYLGQFADGWQWLEPVPLTGEGLALAEQEQAAGSSPADEHLARGDKQNASAKSILAISGGQPQRLQVFMDDQGQPEGFVWSTLRIDYEVSAEHGGWVFPPSVSAANISVVFERVLNDGTTKQRIPVHFAESKDKNPRYYNGFEIAGIHSGWSVPNRQHVISSVWILEKPLKLGANEQLLITIAGNPARRVAFAASPFVPRYGEAETVELVAREAACIGSSLEPMVFLQESVAGGSISADWLALQWCLTRVDAKRVADRKRLRDLEQQILACRGGRWPVMIAVAQEPRETRVLPRGNWQDQSGKVVMPATPHFLPKLIGQDAERLSRLDLANWLVSPQNPLTSRVQINRLWKHFFGNGLSRVLDDFGFQGEYPTHPELLDWLAAEFIESQWDFKHMARLMVTSATYRQASRPDSKAQQIDPSNRLLSHQNARRLEAEVIRDQALFISGLINLELGGPPAFPYQPDNYYAHLQFPDRRYTADRDERQYRRGIYVHWQRTFLHPMLANFDAPAREECTGMRPEANTPQQALTLLNDPTFVEAAIGFARQISKRPIDDCDRITWAFEKALCRKPTSLELESLRQFLITQRVHWQSRRNESIAILSTGFYRVDQNDDVAELASWTGVARVLLNLHETLTRY